MNSKRKLVYSKTPKESEHPEKSFYSQKDIV